MKNILRNAVIIGNMLFALWLLFNGMDEGWKAAPMQALSYFVLITLLVLNTYLITRKQNN